jgi:hypothetical protein
MKNTWWFDLLVGAGVLAAVVGLELVIARRRRRRYRPRRLQLPN